MDLKPRFQEEKYRKESPIPREEGLAKDKHTILVDRFKKAVIGKLLRTMKTAKSFHTS